MDRCIFSGSPRLRGDTGIRACWHESFEPRCGHPPIEGGFILRLGAGFSFLFLAKKQSIFRQRTAPLCGGGNRASFCQVPVKRSEHLTDCRKRTITPNNELSLAREGNAHFKPVKRSEHLTGLKATKSLRRRPEAFQYRTNSPFGKERD